MRHASTSPHSARCTSPPPSTQCFTRRVPAAPHPRARLHESWAGTGPSALGAAPGPPWPQLDFCPADPPMRTVPEPKVRPPETGEGVLNADFRGPENNQLLSPERTKNRGITRLG